MSGYYLLLNGEYAYNKSYSVGFDFGSIKRLDRYPMGALSTLYICFALKRHDSDFIKTYFDSLKWYKEIYMIAAEGARNHGLLNVPTDDFFSTMHTLPCSLDEQRKIASFFCCLEDRIAHQHRLVDTLKSYKRGVSNAIFGTSVSFRTEPDFSSTRWISSTFGEVFDLLASNTLSRAELNYSGGEIKNIHYGDILVKYGAVVAVSSSTVPFVNTDVTLPRSKHSYLMSGDVVIADTAEDLTAGKAIEIENNSGIKCVAGLHTIACRPLLSFAPGYLGHFLNSDYFHNQLRPLIQGTKVSSIARNALMDTTIKFPSPPEQEKISAMLTMIDSRIGAEEKRLALLNECKKSMLQQLFV